MITDASEALPAELEGEVCIAGAGPAGIVLALELARRGRRVILLEGGGSDGPGDGHALYEGEVDGRPYPLSGSRLRWLGGTTNHWGGWVKPLDAVDFRDKAHFPLPAWPFGLDQLTPWYRAAAEWCEVGSDNYDPADVALDESGYVFPLDPDAGFEHHLFRFSPPTRFGTRYRSLLEETENLDCRLNLSAVRLEQDSDRVRRLEARTLHGASCRIRSDYFVLAMGGLENARLLLDQDAVPGNQAGLVGCCFMDHFGYRPGLILARDGLRYRQFQHDEGFLMPVMAPTTNLIKSEELTNACITLAAESPDPQLPPEYWLNPGLPGARANASEALHYAVQLISEPLPHPESRLGLTDERDRLGMRRLRLRWHLPESDFTRVFRLIRELGEMIGSRGLGRLRWANRESVPVDEAPGVGFHHIGTTRMAADEAFGVVNADCRIWDRENLFIAGSSVFPTCGYANPTLTIVALCCRLADHLDKRVKRS